MQSNNARISSIVGKYILFLCLPLFELTNQNYISDWSTCCTCCNCSRPYSECDMREKDGGGDLEDQCWSEETVLGYTKLILFGNYLSDIPQSKKKKKKKQL